MESINDFNKVYDDLNEVASFIKFNRKKKANAIKSTLETYEEKVLSIPALVKSFKGLGEKHSALKGVNENLHKKNTSLVQERVVINLKHDDLSQQHQVLNSTHVALKNRHRELDDKNTNLVQQHQVLNSTHVALKNRHRELDDKNTNLSQQHQVLNSTHVALKNRHRELDDKNTNLVQQHQVLNSTHVALKNRHRELDGKNTNLTQEHVVLNSKHNDLLQHHQTLNSNHNEITTKYDLVSSILNAKGCNNEAMQNFNSLVENDFLDFANQERSLAEEAKALLMLQNIQRELQMISSFPSIYNKNIIAVGGGFSAGKSEFISSFFADNTIKLPIGIKPVTAIPTYISNGEQHIIRGYSYKGGSVDISSKLYAELSHDFIKSFSFNLKDIVPIMAIETEIKNYNNICFIDTPGYNPANTGTTDSDHQTANEYLESANVLLWVIGLDASDGAIPASDLNFLENLSLENKKLFVIANKADLKSPDDLDDILDSFEGMLDEYDIDYCGISAYNSIGEMEVSFRKKSLKHFLQEVDNPISAKEQITLELTKVFGMYETAIKKQLKWTKGIQSELNSLELDFMQDGMDIYENEKASERLGKIKETFKASKLISQLEKLKNLRAKMVLSIEDVFKSI